MHARRPDPRQRLRDCQPAGDARAIKLTFILFSIGGVSGDLPGLGLGVIDADKPGLYRFDDGTLRNIYQASA